MNKQSFRSKFYLLIFIHTVSYLNLEANSSFGIKIPTTYSHNSHDTIRPVLQKDFNCPELEYSDTIAVLTDGQVTLSFTIDTLGHVSNIQIDKSSGNYFLDQQAIKAVNKTSGKWKPAMLKGRKINYEMRKTIFCEAVDE